MKKKVEHQKLKVLQKSAKSVRKERNIAVVETSGKR